MTTQATAAGAGKIWAQQALTSEGWQSAVSVDINAAGQITAVAADQPPSGERTGLLLPSMPNLHSHAFQRAMAGLTETRGGDPHDSFWTWRRLMYRFLDSLTPDDVEAIAAFAQMEMVESGYTSVGEFHYLHHQPDGKPYTNVAEMCERLVSASRQSGVGLTLLPVLYEQGGCDGRALTGGQKRFGNSFDRFLKLFRQAESIIATTAATTANNASIGIAPHSLRAVSKASLTEASALVDGRPFHIHVAEQVAEVEELLAVYGARPVEWLLDNHDVDDSWCLVHATQMLGSETSALARSGAVAGLCPITESNLGDGIFDGVNYRIDNGAWGIGTDSNIRVALGEELRTLEYSQRLRDHSRSVYATPDQSTGRVLYESALRGGAQALQRKTGSIAVGRQADLIALNLQSPAMVAVENDGWLDAWIFADDDSLITDVWSCGTRWVSDGRHINRESISNRYLDTMKKLRSLL
jgi:formimidoylglutamate deiminase